MPIIAFQPAQSNFFLECRPIIDNTQPYTLPFLRVFSFLAAFTDETKDCFYCNIILLAKSVVGTDDYSMGFISARGIL